jgi:hypothetical protein
MALLSLRRNVGTADRAVRLVLGTAMAVYPGLAAWQVWLVAALAAVGGTQLIAGITGY